MLFQYNIMFTFIIPICVKNIIHLRQLSRCINSIRTYHPKNKIILINDSDDLFDISDIFKNDENLYVEKTLNRGSADQQVFKFFLEKDTNDTGFIMQDSMILNKRLENVENVENIKFLWHFTNHIRHWDIINEPITDYNVNNSINTHTDFIKHCLVKNYGDNLSFLNYALNALDNKETWCGCFGNCCIINRQTLLLMDSKIKFIDKFINYTTNRERRVNESIFALFCHFLFTDINFNDSYDGLYYDGIHENKESGTPTGFDNLVWCRKKEYISKISFDR